MNTETESAVKKILDELITLIQENEAPHNYASVRDCILQLELQQEIAVLEAMLEDTATFEQKFRDRCALRESDTDFTIPYHAMPESLTNQMYWQIAQLVFEPETMQEMLHIIVPGIKKYLKVDIHYVSSKSGPQNVRIRRPQTSLELIELDGAFINKNLNMETFAQYVLSDNTLFDVQEIGRFSLNLHAELQNILNNHYPALAKKVYEHNASLHGVSLDILTLNHKGIAPKAALEQLIKGLILGGEKITGEGFASHSARVAAERFFAYFNALSTATKEQLRALEGDNITLGEIIDNQIAKGKCVETTAKHLSCILEQNSDKEILTALADMSLSDLKNLIAKYKPQPEFALDAKKDGSFMPVFPTQLTNDVIKRIAPKTPEQLIMLISNFPPTFYDALWKNITLDNPRSAFKVMIFSIRVGFFDAEQKQALAKAIVKYYPRFGLKDFILFQALLTQDLVFLQEALSSYPENQRLDAVKVPGKEGLTVLHMATAFKPEWIKTILELLPQEQRVNALQVTDNHKNMPVHSAAFNGRTAVIAELAKHGANLDIAANDGATATFIAALSGYADVIVELAKHGANLDIAATEGATPAFVAALNGHTAVIAELIKFGADFDLPCNFTVDDLRVLASQRGKNVYDRMDQYIWERATIAKQRISVTPYDIACIMGHRNIVRLLDEKRHDSNLEKASSTIGLFSTSKDTLSQNRLFPLLSQHLVRYYSLPDASQASLEQGLRVAAANNKIDDLKMFILCVKNLDAQDANPKMLRTALHWAAIKGHSKFYQLLIEANADPMILDADGNTAVDYMEGALVQPVSSGP